MPLMINSVLISEPVDPNCAVILSKKGVKVTTKVGLSKDELKDEIQHYQALIVRSATKVTADVIAAGKSLKIIGRAGVGVDNIDCDAATKHGVVVINAPGGNTLSAAELTCAMIVSLSRNIVEASTSLKSGKWDRKKFMANELMGKTLAIVGLGRIGREVAFRLQSFGMKTIGFDPLVPAEESIKFGVESMDLEKIWPLADYITVHTPLIPQTRNMINSEVFSKCRKGVRIINCARGGIINEDDLVAALESGQCGGAGLDVYMEEPPKNTKLVQHPKVICTPHIGASTHEAQSRVAEEIALQFVDLNYEKQIHGIVNSPAFSFSMAECNRNFITMGKYSGAIAGAMIPSPKDVLRIDITVRADDSRKKESLFSAAVLIGLLKQRNNIDANFVNAPILAKENGYEIASVRICHETFKENRNPCLNLTMKSSNIYENMAIIMKGDQPSLECLGDYTFRSFPPLANNTIICHGEHSTKGAEQIFGAVVEKGLNSFSRSSESKGKCWSAINCSSKCDTMPNILSSVVDFWAQLNL